MRAVAQGQRQAAAVAAAATSCVWTARGACAGLMARWRLTLRVGSSLCPRCPADGCNEPGPLQTRSPCCCRCAERIAAPR